MASSEPQIEPPRRRRLDPQERRQEIVDAARSLFAERPLSAITTTDIAQAAGVSRALVHSYFGGIRHVFLAVMAQDGAALAQVRQAQPGTPLEQRLAFNIAASLDVVAANRETWSAVLGHAGSSGDAEIDALASALTDHNIQRSLGVNSDLVADTPATRAALRAQFAQTNEATRLWLAGQLTRAEVEALLVSVWRNVIRHAIPAMEKVAP